MPFYTDQLHREVKIPLNPKRIVSLVPSQSELLFDLGLDQKVIGITKFCNHPSKWFQTKARVGGTKNLDSQKIKTLNPDLIIANKEENLKDQIEELAKDFPVWISDVTDLASALLMIEELGRITNTEGKANNIIDQIVQNFNNFKPLSNTRLRIAYFIWRQPFMSVGGDTFINDMLQHAGYNNVFKTRGRYPVIEISELSSLNCELILLSSEPYPFKEKHIDEIKNLLQSDIASAIKIKLVDGGMFSWYGSRLIKAPAYFKSLEEEIWI